MFKRYDRQLLLKGFGLKGQEKLRSSTAFIAGVGGLGGTAALYLAVAGIGKLILLHEGPLELPDLNRQILMKNDWMGRDRVFCAQNTLHEINPEVEVRAINDKVRKETITDHLMEADIVLDCRHNFGERYLLNEACVQLNKPMVEAAMEGMEAYLTTVYPGKTPCLACLYPEGRPEWDHLGFPVLGGVSGALGALAAIEAIKVLTGFGEPLYSKKLAFDAAVMEFKKFNLVKNFDCPVCKTQKQTEIHSSAICRDLIPARKKNLNFRDVGG